VTNHENDGPANFQAGSVGTSKDMLFGWLVGRAAADLGLAQALAASEAQREEQFKRLEASLLAQIQELQNQRLDGATLTGDVDELGRVKAEMQTICERMGGLEASARQFAAPELLKAEVAALQAQWSERQNFLEKHRSEVDKVAQDLGARVLELQNQLSSSPSNLDRVLGELNGLKEELRQVAARVAGAETSTEQLQTKTAGDIERGQQLAADLIRAESAALKAVIFERLDSQPSVSSVLHAVENMLQGRAEELRREFSQQTSGLGDHAAELAELRRSLQNLTQRVDSAPAVATPAMDLDAERARLSREVSERVAAAVHEFGNELRTQVQGIRDLNINLDVINSEIVAFAARIANLERAKEQSSAELRLELDSFITELRERQNQLPAVEALLKNVEQTLQTKIQECHDYLAQEQHSLQAREARYDDFTTHLERVGQRMTDAEAMIHQTHALMVNETAQTAQQRDGFSAELAALRAQLRDTQAREAVIHGIESRLEAKIDELQNQLAQRLTGIDQRDAEIRELKAQMQSLLEPISPIETGMPTLNASAAHRMQTPEATPFGAVTRPTLVEDRLRAVPPRSEGAPQRPPAMPRQDDAPQDQVLIEGTDGLKVLQARMSADIERARAELKEKSGRWKVRR
jgi:chromosome segregation ATPase